jgi:thermostable 8-oxoguanine DNA glycosylase
MAQKSVLLLNGATITLALPDEHDEVVSGIKWGSVEHFPTPAYWAFQVISRRVEGQQIRYRLGSNIKEEVGACLLGGHGIPANVGLAAYSHLRALDAFGSSLPTEAQLAEWLAMPLTIEGKKIHYRFAKRKAQYLYAALEKLSTESPPMGSGQALRNWLISIPGIGYKTASWVARNWLDADDVAIIDIHILRAGLIIGIFQSNQTVERHYLDLENRFLSFSEGLGVRPAELDAVIWLEMMSSTKAVQRALDHSGIEKNTVPKAISSRPKQSHPNTHQIPLFA